jgi:hypothetical protein
MTIGIFKEWLVKYFFVHQIILKAIIRLAHTRQIIIVDWLSLSESS